MKINSRVLLRFWPLDNINVETSAFVDSGGNRFSFIDSPFVQKLSLSIDTLLQPRILRFMDGRVSAGRRTTRSAYCHFWIGNQIEFAKIIVTKLGQFPIILGHRWVSHHSPEINLKDDSIKFAFHICRQNCHLTRPNNNVLLDIPASYENNTQIRNLSPHKRTQSIMSSVYRKIPIPPKCRSLKIPRAWIKLQ